MIIVVPNIRPTGLYSSSVISSSTELTIEFY